tara:strand:- start:21114 stop:22295 length:1182 start_codon:yes stop_codon:yes gene_type:complete
MSHLIETYSLLSGAKIGKPYIYEKFFPLPFDNYITLHAQGSTQAKQYDYWQEVVNILRPILDKKEIKIVQIGDGNDRQLLGTHFISGRTCIQNTAYLLQHSKLHVGCDSFPVHIASSYGIPVVALYSSCYSSQAGPYWSDPSEARLMDTPKDKIASYSDKEHPKSINNANPEEIAQKVCELLKEEFSYDYKTIYKGNRFVNGNIDIVPNSFNSLKHAGVKIVNVRMDYLFNEEALKKQLEILDVNIVTNKPISLDILNRFRGKIKKILYCVDEKNDDKFIKILKRNNIPYQMLCYADDSNLNDYKLKFLDYGTIYERHVPKVESLKEFKDIDLDNLYFKSGKFLLSEGKIYPGKYAWENDLAIDKFEHTFVKAKLDKSFREEIENFYIAEKTS